MANADGVSTREIGPAGPPRILFVGISICVVIACLLYLWRLHDTPVAIGGDEAFFAIHGASVAQTGKDLNGRWLPLVIQLDPDTDPGLWYQAMLVYLEALAFLILPVTEWSARLPVALLAIVNVALVWAAAARYGRGALAGPLAAFVLALSPTYFFLSRQALDYICPIFFVLIWLLQLKTLHEAPRVRTAFGCGLVLGFGVFSYVSSWLMMPVYLLCTLAVCVARPGRLRLCAAALLGFALPVGMLAIWLASYPDALASVLNRYAGSAAQLPGLNINTYYRIVDFVSAYWNCWNPAQLFLLGSPNPIIGVRSAGVFVAPVALLFTAGLVAMARAAPPLSGVLIAGLITAPLGPVLYGTPGVIQRQLVLLPFVAIVAALGADYLWSRRSKAVRWSTNLAVAACPAVFAVAAYDVFAEHQSYAVRFDPSNFRELTPALAALDAQSAASRIVLAIGPYDRRAYWRFHTEKLGKHDLFAKTALVDAASFGLQDVTANSLVVASAPSALATELDRACTRLAVLKAEADVVVWRAEGAGCARAP